MSLLLVPSSKATLKKEPPISFPVEITFLRGGLETQSHKNKATNKVGTIELKAEKFNANRTTATRASVDTIELEVDKTNRTTATDKVDTIELKAEKNQRQ